MQGAMENLSTQTALNDFSFPWFEFDYLTPFSCYPLTLFNPKLSTHHGTVFWAVRFWVQRSKE
jgi:hypothetical protein